VDDDLLEKEEEECFLEFDGVHREKVVLETFLFLV
jgi:hypothetical protein